MDTLSKNISLIIKDMKKEGLYKDEKILLSQQNSEITVNNKEPINIELILK